MRNYLSYTILLVFYLVSCKSHKSNVKSNSVNEKTSIKKEYSIKLGVNESEISNEKLYSFIDDWYGVVYKYGGKNKDGVDCSSLTSILYANVYNRTIPFTTKELYGDVKKINETELREGDLVFFNTNGKSISHVGVYLMNNKFVHASSKKGVMISDLNEAYFRSTYVCSGRLKD
jgi:murein DD-endopeptidase / murein LD-carboxypeptidase